MTEPPGDAVKNLALIIPSLVGGGAERIAIDLANHWVKQGHRVTLLTIDAVRTPHYSVDPRVTRVGLGLLRDSRSLPEAIWQNLARVRKLRRAIRESAAECVVSFTDVTNVTTLLACRGWHDNVVVCERTDPRHQPLGRSWSWLRRRLYHQARALVVQTAAVAQWAAAQGWRIRVHVLPNAVLLDENELDLTDPAQDLPRPAIVALGRLSPEKGMDLLIEAFARVAHRHPEWQLRIYGEGRERAALESLARQLQVDGRVHLAGWTKSPAAAHRQADLFVLPSRYEGFPNALLEAMASGLASISFDCDSGPREIIRDGIDGILVPALDAAALAEALQRLMADAQLRSRLGERAREVTQRFNRALYYRHWDAILTGA